MLTFHMIEMEFEEMPKSKSIPSQLQMLEPKQSEEADNDLILLMDYNTISLLFSDVFIENVN